MQTKSLKIEDSSFFEFAINLVFSLIFDKFETIFFHFSLEQYKTWSQKNSEGVKWKTWKNDHSHVCRQISAQQKIRSRTTENLHFPGLAAILRSNNPCNVPEKRRNCPHGSVGRSNLILAYRSQNLLPPGKTSVGIILVVSEKSLWGRKSYLPRSNYWFQDENYKIYMIMLQFWFFLCRQILYISVHCWRFWGERGFLGVRFHNLLYFFIAPHVGYDRLATLNFAWMVSVFKCRISKSKCEKISSKISNTLLLGWVVEVIVHWEDGWYRWSVFVKLQLSWPGNSEACCDAVIFGAQTVGDGNRRSVVRFQQCWNLTLQNLRNGYIDQPVVVSWAWQSQTVSWSKTMNKLTIVSSWSIYAWLKKFSTSCISFGQRIGQPSINILNLRMKKNLEMICHSLQRQQETLLVKWFSTI